MLNMTGKSRIEVRGRLTTAECGISLAPTGIQRQESFISPLRHVCGCRSEPASYLHVDVPQLFGENVPLLYQLALFGQQLTHLLGTALTVTIQLLQSAEHTHTHTHTQAQC